MGRPTKEIPPTHPILEEAREVLHLRRPLRLALLPLSQLVPPHGDVHELRQLQQRSRAQRLPTVQHLPSRNERAHPPTLDGGTFDLRPGSLRDHRHGKERYTLNLQIYGDGGRFAPTVAGIDKHTPSSVSFFLRMKC